MKATRELAVEACTTISTSCSEALDVLVDALLEDGKLMTSTRFVEATRARAKLRRAAFRWAQSVTGFQPALSATAAADAPLTPSAPPDGSSDEEEVHPYW